jgi:enoyl-CoA hydratase/carnithine racemase
MSRFDQYQDKFRNIRFDRRNGILQMSVHTDGGPLTWGALDGSVHTQLGQAFYEIGRDPDNRVLIMTGTGDAFCTQINSAEMLPRVDAAERYRITREGKDLLMNLLDIEVPVIGAVNGPAYIHAQLPVLSDVVLAAEHAEFADLAHFAYGIVPGDSVQVVWPMLLGPNRGRYFLMTGQRLSAREALALGVVSEVLPAEQLLPRAWALAEDWIEKPVQTLRYTRVALTQSIKKRMLDELGYGMALEGLGIAAQAEPHA